MVVKMTQALKVETSLQYQTPIHFMDTCEANALAEGQRVDCPVEHVFTDKLYTRVFHAKADTYVISRIHNVEHPFFVLQGLIAVKMEDGSETILKAGQYGVTKPGTQRMLYIHEDCTFITVHPNPENETDPEKIVDAVTVPYVNPITGISHSEMTRMQYATLPDERTIPALS